MELTTNFLISQFLALLAFISGIIAFQFKRRESVLRMFFVSALFNSVHQFLLMQSTAGLIVFVTSIRFLTSSFTTNKILMYVFISISLIISFFTVKHPINILGLIATIAGTIGAFNKNHIITRYLMLVSILIWCLHNYLIQSPVATIMEAFFAVSNIVALIRFKGSRVSVPAKN